MPAEDLDQLIAYVCARVLAQECLLGLVEFVTQDTYLVLLCENLTFRDECRAFFSSLCSAYLEAFTWDACSPRVCSLRDDYCRCVVLDGPTGILTPRGRAWSRSSSSRRYSNVDDYACSSSRHSQSSLAGGGQHLHLLYSVPYRPMGNHITLLRIRRPTCVQPTTDPKREFCPRHQTTFRRYCNS